MKNKSEYIAYRFQCAIKSYEDALLLVENNRWNAAVNRLYYSCFYAVLALLLKNGIETQTHDGAKVQFGLKFVKTGLTDKKFGIFLSKIFDYRQKGDYGDMFDFNKETVDPLIPQANEFLQELQKLMTIANL
jgi:uncharacterized protein (UPF0332 family)